MSTRRLTVAILGAGIGELHAEAFERLASLYEVALICDRNTERAERLAAKLATAGLMPPRLVTDFADVAVTAKEIDIVNVCLPPFLHGAAVRRALQAGKHVICEKPLVASLRELDELAGLAGARGVQLMPVFQYRFGNGLAKARHLIETGASGKVYLTTIETHWTRGADYYAVEWRGRRETELGGVLAGHAIHAHDALTHLLGDVRSVAAMAAVRVNDIETEDCSGVLLEMADGSIAVSSATLGSADEISRLRVCCETVTMVSDLSPYTPTSDPWTFIPKAPKDETFIAHALAGAPTGPEGYTEQFQRFHACLTAGGDMPVTLAEGRRSIELLSAIYHSSRVGARVRLPIGADHPVYRGWSATSNG
jgi:predicted dehydrogenase